MPSNDKKLKEEDMVKVKDSQAVTLVLAGKDSLFYYEGQPKYKDWSSLKLTTYTPTGLRKFLLAKNSIANSKINELKEKKRLGKIKPEEFKKLSEEIKGNKDYTPVVIIKATDNANYKNLIDALDEMQICNIGRYVIDKISPAEVFLMKNYRSKGDLSRNSAK